MLTLRDLRRIVDAKYTDCARRVVAESERLDGDVWMRYAEEVQRGPSVVLHNDCVELLNRMCEAAAGSLPDHELELLWFESDHCLHFSECKKANRGDWIHGVSEELISRVADIAGNEDLEEREDEEVFELTEDEQAFVHEVIDMLQTQLRRADLTSRSRRGLARAIGGLRAIPRAPAELHVVCTFQQVAEGGTAFTSILISSESLEFDSGGKSYSSGIGSDSTIGTGFGWYVGGDRDGSGDPEIWIMSAINMIAAGASIRIDDEFTISD